MENSLSQFGMCRNGILLCFLGFLFLLCHGAKAEDRERPTWNPNLTPFQQWRSAYFCLLNFNATTNCTKNHVLDMNGWLNVTKEDGPKFCSSSCVNETRKVLDCIHHTKRDFWFINKATVVDINHTIDDGCGDKGFSGVSYYPHHK